MRRQARLFALVEHLRARRTGVTAEQLAERFGTSVRTIYRDLDTLREGALPLRADRGRGGGYALDHAYGLPPVNFSAREAAVLLTVGRWATELRLMPFQDTLGVALDKVRGALSPSAQRDLVAHMESLRFAGIPAHAAAPKVRAELERAWFERAPVEIRYRSSEGHVSTRVVRIESVLMDRTATLLGTEEVGSGERRTVRLDRVEAAKPVPA